MKLRTINIKEGDAFTIPENTSRGWLSGFLWAANRVRKGSAVITQSDGPVQTSRIVGTFQRGDLRVNILPKISSQPTAGNTDIATLASLLAEAGEFNERWLRFSSASGVESICEMSFRIFAHAVEEAVGAGIPRFYREQANRGLYVRGRISLGEVHANTVKPELGLATIHAPLTFDNPLTRSLSCVAEAIAEMSTNHATRQSLDRIRYILGAAGVKRTSLLTAIQQQDKLAELRINDTWSPIRNFILNFLSDLSLTGFIHGDAQFYSQLYHVENLFEKLLRKRLREALLGTSLTVLPKRPQKGILRRVNGNQPISSCTADILVEHKSQDETTRLIICDVKWKSLNGKAFAQPNNADVYQVSYYLKRHGAQRAVLFYPKTPWMQVGPECCIEEFQIIPEGYLAVCAVSLWDLLLPHNAQARLDAVESIRTFLLRLCI